MNRKMENQRFSTSLVLRVFLIILALLVIPLIFYTAFMYRHDYAQQKETAIKSLDLFLEQQQDSYSELLGDEYKIMLLMDKIVNTQRKLALTTKLGMQHLLKDIADTQKVSKIFYLVTSGNSKGVCRYSSDESMVGQKFTHLSTQFTENGLLVQSMQSGEDKLILFSQKATPNPFLKEQEAIYVAVTPQQLGQLVFDTGPLMQEYTAMIIDENDEIITSTNNKLIGKTMDWKQSKEMNSSQIKTTALSCSSEEKVCTFELAGMQYYAKISLLKSSSLSLVVTVPSRIALDPTIKYLWRVGLFLFFILIFGGLGASLITYRFSRPLRALCELMNRVGQGEETARFHTDPLGFEINIVGQIFNSMITDWVKNRDQAEHERVQKEILAKELMIGRDVQHSLLPVSLPHFPKVEMAAGFSAAKEVSGDFYDAFVRPTHPNELMLSIADASGKGVDACLYSLSLRSIFRSLAGGQAQLEKMVFDANEIFCQDTADHCIFVTAWLGCYNAIDSTLWYTSCGHWPAILKRSDGETSYLQTQGMAFGVNAFDRVFVEQVTLESGDFIVLFTDGVVEAENQQRDHFGRERLLKILRSQHFSKPQDVVDTIIRDLKNFEGGTEPFDDCTLLVLKVL